jgi:hypothetical protein
MTEYTNRQRYSLAEICDQLDPNWEYVGGFEQPVGQPEAARPCSRFPTIVIPFIAGFNTLNAHKFCCKLASLKQTMSNRHITVDDKDPMIIIVLSSLGGDVRAVQQMTSAVMAFKQVTGCKVVTILRKMVASCGFVFAESADYLVALTGALMLCHQPSLSYQSDHVTAPELESMSISLKATKEKLYSIAEIGFLLRFMHKTEKDTKISGMTNDKVIEARIQWYQIHEKDIIAMRNRYGVKMDYDGKTNIFEYLTEVVEDKDNHVIEHDDLLLFGFVDKIDCLPVVVSTTTIDMDTNALDDFLNRRLLERTKVTDVLVTQA